MTQFPWTDEETDAARRLAAEGLGAREIARRLGRTRNAVIGRLNRAGRGVLAENAPPEPEPALAPCPEPESVPDLDPRLCHVAGCRRTRQPGRAECHLHISERAARIPRRNRDAVTPAGGGGVLGI